MLKVKLYGLEGDMGPDRKRTNRLVIVALSAQPPGVNKLFVCLSDPCFQPLHMHHMLRRFAINRFRAWIIMWLCGSCKLPREADRRASLFAPSMITTSSSIRKRQGQVMSSPSGIFYLARNMPSNQRTDPSISGRTKPP
jgi:hypothetical protein